MVLTSFIVTCSEQDEYEDVEVTIVSLSTYSNTKILVQYTVENTGTKVINGWEVFINVHMQGGPQILVSESIYYTLEPGKISSKRILEAPIPVYYQYGSYPRSATLKNIETW